MLQNNSLLKYFFGCGGNTFKCFLLLDCYTKYIVLNNLGFSQTNQIFFSTNSIKFALEGPKGFVAVVVLVLNTKENWVILWTHQDNIYIIIFLKKKSFPFSRSAHKIAKNKDVKHCNINNKSK